MAEFTRTQYDFNSRIVLNDNTSDTTKFILLKNNSIFDTVVQNTEEERPVSPGIVDYGSKLSKGILDIPVMLYASTIANMAQLIEDFKEAFNPDLLEADSTYGEAAGGNGYHPLNWTETVGATSRAFRIYAKAVETPRMNQDSFAGLARSSRISLKVQDPRKYLQAQTTLAGAGTATNAGTYPTPVVITGTATGATSTSLQITNSTTGKTIYITTALANNDVIVIDTRKHSIKKNGTETRSLIGAGTDWWSLNPGANTIAFTNTTNITFSTAWRSAWPI